ncbi:hypothetical protein CEXT_745171 [Caerostris extrusa]|uniref:Uncharacterized protein n=1 Tax=Caerostris extrusa TaxID=172846 RepID=A0AAV4VVV5_CAEEX|nr:hypothetical protein CEXT_745171 [Caerostris extrusa]
MKQENFRHFHFLMILAELFNVGSSFPGIQFYSGKLKPPTLPVDTGAHSISTESPIISLLFPTLSEIVPEHRSGPVDACSTASQVFRFITAQSAQVAVSSSAHEEMEDSKFFFSFPVLPPEPRYRVLPPSTPRYCCLEGFLLIFLILNIIFC